jgi:hypothetical protein
MHIQIYSFVEIGKILFNYGDVVGDIEYVY